MASVRSRTSSRRRRRRASSASSPTRNRAATWSGQRSGPPARPGKADLLACKNQGIADVIGPGLRVLFVGINPGLYTAWTGHHFARPGNRFWPALHRAGFSTRELPPAEQRSLLHDGYGITNLVNRATATAEEVGPAEFVAGRRRLAAKVRKYRPKIVAFLGVGAYCHGFGLKTAAIGPQPDLFEGAKVWVLPNPSGLNANYQLPDLVKLFCALRMHASGHAFRNNLERGKGTRTWQPSSTRPSSAKSRSTASRTC